MNLFKNIKQFSNSVKAHKKIIQASLKVLVLSILVIASVGLLASKNTTKTTAVETSDMINVKDYGATGDGNTDDTEAIQDAFNAATISARPVFFPDPVNEYKLTDTIQIKLRGQIIQGQNPWSTIIRQTSPDKHAFEIFDDPTPHEQQGHGNNLSIAFRDLRLAGPGASVSTAHGIHAAPVTGSYNGDWLLTDNVTIFGFETGVYTSDWAQMNFENSLFHYNKYNVQIFGNANSVHFNNTAVARATAIGVVIGGGRGTVIESGDMGSEPKHVLVKAFSQVTLIGGNFESATGTEAAIDVETNGELIAIGNRFLKNAGGEIPAYRAAANSKITVIGSHRDGFSTAPLTKKSAATSDIRVMHPTNFSANERSEDHDGTTYYPSLFANRLDNGIPPAAAQYRGTPLSVYRRSTAADEDRLIYYVQLANGSYEAVDLVSTRHLYSTVGTGHTRKGQIRNLVGRKPFNTASGNKTTVVINVGAFADLQSATATPYVNTTGAQAYVVLNNWNPSTGDITYVVHHPATGAGATWQLHYTIDVKY